MYYNKLIEITMIVYDCEDSNNNSHLLFLLLCVYTLVLHSKAEVLFSKYIDYALLQSISFFSMNYLQIS